MSCVNVSNTGPSVGRDDADEVGTGKTVGVASDKVTNRVRVRIM